MKRFSSLSASVLALSLALGGQAMAQTSHDQHHPGAADMRLAQATQMPGGGPMGQGAMGQGMGQGMMGDGMMQMMAGNCPMMGNMMGGGTPAFSGGRIAFLKAELAITDAQKSEWDSYAAALETNLDGMQGMRQSMMTAMSAGTPSERLVTRIAAMESRIAALKDVKPALDKLYAALSADQKKKADQILTGMGCMM